MTGSLRYPLLFSPLKVGPVTLANRVVFSAHLTNYAEDGRPSAQHAAYYAARAAGGAGLVITEEHSVHPTDWPYEKLIHGYDPGVVPGYRAITDAVHHHGTPIFAQINHNGGQGSSMYSRLALWAPSPVADPLFREVPKAVEPAEIAEIVSGYATVARHCMEGGFDGIELQCSHSSIVRGFLSPATNLRTDAYGGTLERRARLLLEILDAVASVVGDRLAIGVRLCGDELVEGGTTIDEAVEVARLVEAQGCADYVNTSIGVATATLYMIEASMQIPPGYASYISSAIRDAVSLPVVGVGRYKDPLQAERALKAGHCDLVGVVRGQIADPDFTAKARAGRTDSIRLCLSCNQECVGRMGLNRWLGCIENPRAGKEAEAARLGRGPSPQRAGSRRVVVVGAGPAGLQSAIAAGTAGHQITVLERTTHPGGALRLAATVPGRAELGDLVRNQMAACRELGVEIFFDTEATVDSLVGVGPDAVVIATGARPETPWWAADAVKLRDARAGGAPEAEAGREAPRVADVTEVLSGEAVPQGAVLVVDEIGFHQGPSVAELLADRGCRVEICTPAMVVGQDLGITLDLEGFLMRAAKRHISLTTDRVVMDLGPGGVTLLHHPTGTEEIREVDWVVLAVPPGPDDLLALELRAAAPGLEVHLVGDCLAPRRAHAAVIEGDRVGAAL